MAAKTLDEWYNEFMHKNQYSPSAQEIWDAAIKSIEGVQNQTNNIGMVQLLAVEKELALWPALSQYMRERIISRLSQQHHT